MNIKYVIRITILICSCNLSTKNEDDFSRIAELAPNWQGEIIAESKESYIGWDVEIGDADNDGKNEILTTSCPSSALYMSKLVNGKWHTKIMRDYLANDFPGMALTAKIVDLNADGAYEIIVGTGQENKMSTAFYYTFRIDNSGLETLNICHPSDINKSNYTHNLAFADVDNDEVLEVFSSYCGGGEVVRYDLSKDLKTISARKIYHLSGSGEETIIDDVDNDGAMELIVSNSFRKDDAKVEIFEFNRNGEIIVPPRLILDGYDNKKCFYASIIVGDVDNDGEHEMVVGWKENQEINRATILAYKITEQATPKYTFTYNDESLDMSYFEKMMVIADADNDGDNELLVSTRGDNQSENIESKHLGHVFMYSVQPDGLVSSQLIVGLSEKYAESSWIDVGDADNDGNNEIVIATGKGDRKKPGKSYLLIVKKV